MAEEEPKKLVIPKMEDQSRHPQLIILDAMKGVKNEGYWDDENRNSLWAVLSTFLTTFVGTLIACSIVWFGVGVCYGNTTVQDLIPTDWCFAVVNGGFATVAAALRTFMPV